MCRDALANVSNKANAVVHNATGTLESGTADVATSLY
jgi:hypothetical protein